ncbi:MAG: tetratricopeptide repeat protein [Pseudomonadota bacterium]|nr:tetratricopeptide repeat protein [Pseudomonadota bacterium]
MSDANAEAEATLLQLQTALDHHRAGRLREAEPLYRQILRVAPDHPDALHWLGVLAHQAGQSDAALALIDRAIAIHSSRPVYHDHRGMVLQALGKAEEAVVCHRTAIALKADYAEAHNNLGNALKTLGRLDEAAESYRAALSLKPDFAEAHNNLGTIFHEQGKLAEAVVSYRNALSFRQNDATSHYNLGNALRDLGKLDAAIDCYRRAISFRLDYAEAHNNLGNVLNATGRFDAALVSYQRALELKETPEFKSNFVRCLQSAEFTEVDAGVRRMVIRAVSEPWTRPADLAAACIRLIAGDGNIRECIERSSSAWPTRLTWQELFGPAGFSVLSNDPLLRALLENAQVCDLAMERLLTMVRHAVLDATTGGAGCDDIEGSALTFCCAVARQCFINDFVFSCTDAELDRVTLLREKFVAQLRIGNAVPALWIAAVAAYFPLLSLPGAEALLDRSWPESVTALLEQQIAEPLEERSYRDHIPRLTPVDDGMSGSVRQQYEENPFPRWVKLPPPRPARDIDSHLSRLFPFAPFRPIDRSGDIDILIAGCGTGRESIEMAQDFPGAHVLAVDLSLSSLCYAKRKTSELGVVNVEHAQADIMKLGSIGRTFAVITSVGVLHHLADPMAGWRELLSLLRPGGFMLLGLYSERARRSVVAAREFIAQRGYLANAADIRRCRQDLMSMNDGTQFGQLASIRDFYVTGECRDLLFHVQEHRFALPQIKEMLGRLGLRLIGFLLAPHVAKGYAARFPEDKAMTDLERWNTFEAEFPDTFAGMYVFWVQKADVPESPASVLKDRGFDEHRFQGERNE